MRISLRRASVLIVPWFLIVVCACDARTGPDNPSHAWIWLHAVRPIADDDAADAFLELLALSGGRCDAANHPEIIKSLTRIARAERNSIVLVPIKLPLENRRYFRIKVRDTQVSPEQMTAVRECIKSIAAGSSGSERELTGGRGTSRGDLARCLLILGWQLSRNGEDKVQALNRLWLWDQAVDLLFLEHPERRDELESQRTLLRQEAEQVKSMETGTLWEPFR